MANTLGLFQTIIGYNVSEYRGRNVGLHCTSKESEVIIGKHMGSCDPFLIPLPPPLSMVRENILGRYLLQV